MIAASALWAWSSEESVPQARLAEALARARTEQKLVLVNFVSAKSWCNACQNLGAEVARTAEFLAYAGTNFVVVVIDDESPQLPTLEDKYDVGSWPTLLVLDSKGTPLGRVAGYSKGTGCARIISELDKIRLRK